MHAYIDQDTDEPGKPDAPQVRQPGELGLRFDRLHGLAAGQVFTRMARTMHAADLTFSQLNVISQLEQRGAQRIADLAQGAHLSHCATSRLVSRLEREGFVEKHRNSANGRERLVRLTPRGRELFRGLQRSTARAYETLFRTVPAELAGRFLELLKEVEPYLHR